MDATIFTSLFAWAQGAIASGVVGNLAYDGLKKLTQSFAERFRKFFSSDHDTKQYFEALCKEKAKNSDKPYRDAEDLYEAIVQTPIKEEIRSGLIEELKSWINDNREMIVNIHTNQQDNAFSIQIGTQQAKQIVNIQGTAHINEFK